MKLTRSDKIGIAGISLLLTNILLQTVIFPSILKSKVKKRVALKNGWPMRQMWSEFTFEHHWYLFNITNPDEINKGEKPKLREVGPFVYDGRHEKVNQEDHEEDDTVSYSIKNTYFFNQGKSNGLDDEDELMVPHFVMLGVPNALMRDRIFLMPIASRAIDRVLHNPQSMFVQAKARTFLFDGFIIDCRGMEDFHGKVLCNELRDYYENYFVRKLGEALYASSMWGPFNASNAFGKRLRIRRGIKDIKEIGKLEEYKNKKNFSAWKTDYCNAFQGTDYSIFPPFFNVKEKENFFTSFCLVCRSFEFTYDSTVKYKGLKLLRYTTLVGVDGQNKPEDKCYCVDPNQCPPKGVFDLFKCLSIPLFISSPHFYQADEQLVRMLDGVKPDKEKHMMIIDIDPLTGIAVRINMRFQLSFNILPLKKYRLMEKFPNAILPIGWFDQQTILPDSVIKYIKACHRIVTISKVFNYLLIISGLGMCAYAGYCRYNSRREKQTSTIKQLSAENSIKNSSGENKITVLSASVPTPVD